MQNGSGQLLGNFEWENSRHGTLGWVMWLATDYNETMLVCGTDVCQSYIKGVDETLWTPIATLESTPSGIIEEDGQPGSTPGGYHGSFGGQSSDIFWLVMRDKVMRSENMSSYPNHTFAETDITGFTVNANDEYIRQMACKGAADPTSDDAYYVCMTYNGFKATVDGGVTQLDMTWLPIPRGSPYIHSYTVSSSTEDIGTGSRTFIVDTEFQEFTGIFYSPGYELIIHDGNNFNNHMIGTITSWNSGTGELVVNVTEVRGSGSSLSNWYIDSRVSSSRQGLIAIDPTSSLTSGRHERIAFSPAGCGIYLSDNGGVSGTEIGLAAGIEMVYDMQWINGKLYVATCSMAYTTVPYTDNIKRWTEGVGWENIDTSTGRAYAFITPDTRYTEGFWLTDHNNGFMHSDDAGATFTITYGNNVNAQTYPVNRPLMAKKISETGAASAKSKPIISDGRLYQPHGLGITSTPVADWPTEDAIFNTPHWDAKWPDWREEGDGIEELVGLCCAWAGNTLHCGAGDAGIQVWEDGSRGHLGSVRQHRQSLGNATSLAAGDTNDYAVGVIMKQGFITVPGVCYATNNTDWTAMENQPVVNGAAIGEPNCVVAGRYANGEALYIPGLASGYPQYVSGLGAGSNTWAEIEFRLEDNTLLDLTDATFGYAGFQGSGYYSMHHLACHDNDNPGNFYIVNLGASDNHPTSDAFADPLGWGGIYHMAPEEFGVFRRIHDGHPALYGNFGYYACKLLVDGAGHLVFMPNRLPFQPYAQDNYTIVYDIATDTITPITTVCNIQSITFGAPLVEGGPKSLWMLGNAPDPSFEWGLFVSWDLGVTVQGPFNGIPYGGGFLRYIDGHPTKFGVIGAAVDSQGHAIGRYKYEF